MHERTKMTKRRERERDPFDKIKVFFNETKSTSRGGTKNARVPILLGILIQEREGAKVELQREEKKEK
jgi:hypothetical protein